MKNIQELIEISQFYGKNSDFVIGGGGNTSFKTADRLWVKASGISLGDIDVNGFAVLDRARLSCISTKQYSADSTQREQEIKDDLYGACVEPEKMLRPSVETSLHDIIRYRFVVHTHPTLVNALLCSQNATTEVKKIFGDKVVYVPYTDPGYVLFKKVERSLQKYRELYDADPQIILLENHGIFVSADTVAEIKDTYNNVMSKIEAKILNRIDMKTLPLSEKAVDILSTIQGLLSCTVAVVHNNTLLYDYLSYTESLAPFTPDIIVYCKAFPIFIENTGSKDDAVDEFKDKLKQYRNTHGYNPKIVILKDLGLAAIDENQHTAKIALAVYEDLMKICLYSKNFGGPHYLNQREIAFIDNWEVENYRRAVSKKSET